MVDTAHLRVGTPAEMAGALTRSHLADGRVLGWFGAAGVVVDAETAGAPVPPALAARFGVELFWERWTAAECGAKAADVPIALWLREHGLSAGGLDVTTLHLDGLVVSVGRAVPGITTPVGVTPEGEARHIVERFPAGKRPA